MTKITYSRWVIPSLIISIGLGILLLTFLVSSPIGQVEAAPAATYAVTWYTADNGGGISSGGSYEVAGTIGQMDAASDTTNPSYGLTGGFWTAFVDWLYEIFLPVILK